MKNLKQLSLHIRNQTRNKQSTPSNKMSQETYSCAELLQVTEAEQKEAWDQLKASAKVYHARRALVESERQLQILLDNSRAKNSNRDFTLCQRCVVASPEEQLHEPDVTPQ